MLAEALYDNNCFVDNVFMDEEPTGERVMMNNVARHDCHPGTGQQPMMEEDVYAQPVVSSAEPLGNITPLQNSTGQ